MNQNSGASLTSLYDDALMAVLLRTRASDHANLRLVCKRIRDIIDSVQFRKERSVQGFAEVEVDLLSPFEQYQQHRKCDGGDPPSEEDDEFLEHYDDLGYMQEYGDHSFDTSCFQIFVDGRPMHKLRQEKKTEFKLHVRLLALQAGFWDVCDCHNQALFDLGISLFTNMGKPKVASLKNTLAGAHDYDVDTLLYMEDFYVPFEYRMTASTVGPLLIKKTLQLFQDLYSIAVYIPFWETQFTTEAAETEKEMDRNRRYKAEKTDEDIDAEEERAAQYVLLKHQDMRQFFRAGFYQVDDRDIVETSDYSCVFTTPVDVEKPILSVEEAGKRPIAIKVPPRPQPRGLARELQFLVEKTSIELNRRTDNIEQFRSPRQNPLFGRLFDGAASRLQQLRDHEDELSASVQQRGLMGLEVADLEEARDKARSSRIDYEQSSNQDLSEFQVALIDAAVTLEAKLETFKGEVRDEIKLIMEKSESPLQIVLDSDVIHLTAAADHMDLLEMVLDFVPVTEKSKVLNGLDRNGLTPLMVVAGVTASRDLIKCRQTVEALIDMGADKNTVHASKGLSAFGYFRDVRRQAERSRLRFGLQGPSAELQAEASRIEGFLRPANGPTFADDAILEAKDASDSDSDDDDDNDESD